MEQLIYELSFFGMIVILIGKIWGDRNDTIKETFELHIKTKLNNMNDKRLNS